MQWKKEWIIEKGALKERSVEKRYGGEECGVGERCREKIERMDNREDREVQTGEITDNREIRRGGAEKIEAEKIMERGKKIEIDLSPPFSLCVIKLLLSLYSKIKLFTCFRDICFTFYFVSGNYSS